MSRKPTQGIDYTSRDYEAYRTLLIQKLQEKMPEYTDTSQTDAGIVILECLANGLDIVSLYNDVIANDLFLPTTKDRRLAVLLARQLGYYPYNQTASIIQQVFVLSEVLDRDILIPKGTVVHTEESSDMVTVYFETTGALIIPSGYRGDEKNEDGTYKYLMTVEQGSSVSEDLLGSSNGQPYQSFKLNYKEVITNSIELLVNEGDGYSEWTQVNSFMDSDIDSKHYTATVDEFDNCYIEFGSGVRGRIPEIFDGGVIASYKIGGGSVGNVKANSITKVEDSIAFVESTFNPYSPLVLGHEKETIEEIQENAPASYRTQDRAITEQDYADLLRINFYEVFSSVGIKSKEMKLHMNLYYQLRIDYLMTESLKESIVKFFGTRVIPGTSFTIHEPEDFLIKLEVNLIINDDYDKDSTVETVRYYVENSFFGYGQFTFKSKFVKSVLESEVRKTIPGVESFRVISPNGDIIQAPNDYQIIKIEALTFNVTGGRDKEV